MSKLSAFYLPLFLILGSVSAQAQTSPACLEETTEFNKHHETFESCLQDFRQDLSKAQTVEALSKLIEEMEVIQGWADALNLPLDETLRMTEQKNTQLTSLQIMAITKRHHLRNRNRYKRLAQELN